MACSQRGGTVKITYDLHLHGIETLLEIGTYGSDKYHEQILLGGLHPYLGTCTDQQRPDIERGTFTIRRNILQIQLNRLQHYFCKKLHRNFSHHDAFGRVDHPLGIFLKPENPDLAIFAGKSL